MAPPVGGSCGGAAELELDDHVPRYTEHGASLYQLNKQIRAKWIRKHGKDPEANRDPVTGLPYEDGSGPKDSPLKKGEHASGDKGTSLFYEELVLIAMAQDDGDWEFAKQDAYEVFDLLAGPDGTIDIATLRKFSAAINVVDGGDIKSLRTNSGVLNASGHYHIGSDSGFKLTEEESIIADFFLKQEGGPLYDLLDPDTLEIAFKELDKNKDGEVQREEFQDFLLKLRKMRLNFYKQKALFEVRAFWGRGQIGSKNPRFARQEKGKGQPDQVEGPDKSGEDTAHLGCCTAGPRGWGEDYWYAIKQEHPIISMFCSDKDHPISKPERVVMEFVALSYCYFGATWDNPWKSWDPVLWGFLTITIPSVMINVFLRTILGCPCLMNDRSMMRRKERQKDRVSDLRFAAAGWIAAALMFGAGVAFLYLGSVQFQESSDHKGNEHIATWLIGRAAGYIVYPVTPMLMAFNVFCCGEKGGPKTFGGGAGMGPRHIPHGPGPNDTCCGIKCCAQPLLTINQWSYEQDLVIQRIQESKGLGDMEKIKARRADHIREVKQKLEAHRSKKAGEASPAKDDGEAKGAPYGADDAAAAPAAKTDAMQSAPTESANASIANAVQGEGDKEKEDKWDAAT